MKDSSIHIGKDEISRRKDQRRSTEPRSLTDFSRIVNLSRSNGLDEILDASQSRSSAPNSSFSSGVIDMRSVRGRRSSFLSSAGTNSDDISIGSQGVSVFSCHSTGVLSRRYSGFNRDDTSNDNTYLNAPGISSQDDGYSSDSYASGDFEDLVSIKSENSGQHLSSSSMNFSETSLNFEPTTKSVGQLKAPPNFASRDTKSRKSSSHSVKSRAARSESALSDKTIRPSIEMASTVNFFSGFRQQARPEYPKTLSNLGKNTFMRQMDDEDYIDQTSMKLKKNIDANSDAPERKFCMHHWCSVRKFLTLILFLALVAITSGILMTYFLPEVSSSEFVKRMKHLLPKRFTANKNDVKSTY